MILAAVTVTAINHDKTREFSLLQLSGGLLDFISLVVGTRLSTTKNDVTAVITLGLNNGGKTLLCNRKEVVTIAGSLDSINSNTNSTIGTVLETNRA